MNKSSIINIMPEGGLTALESLLAFIADDYWKPVIKAASPEEIAMAEERIKDFERNLSRFIPLSDIR